MKQKIVVEEMRSGEDDGVLWVSLGFRSELSEYDVLFIVCGKVVNEQEMKLGRDGLYFERFDQINSCYNAAESILVVEDGIDIELTEDGRRQLKLAEQLRLDCGAVASEFRDARKVFRKIAEHEWAKAIHFT